MNDAQTQQEGFSLIEFILAMAVYTFMLLIILSGFMAIVQLHQAGVAARDSQQNARFVVEDIVRNVRGSDDTKVNAAGTELCIANGSVATRYRVDPGTLQVMRGTATADCNNATAVFSESPLTSTAVAVRGLQFVGGGASGKSRTVQIRLSVSTGTSFTYNGAPGSMRCDVSQPRSQYCTVANMNSSATARGIY